MLDIQATIRGPKTSNFSVWNMFLKEKTMLPYKRLQLFLTRDASCSCISKEQNTKWKVLS